MLRRIGKRYLAVLLAVLMMVPLFTTGASADYTMNPNIPGLGASNVNNYWTWNGSSSQFVLSINTVKEAGGCGDDDAYYYKEDTLTLTNNLGRKAKLQFAYTSSANGGTITMPPGASNGTFSRDLNAGESITIYGKSSTTAERTTTITLSTITLTPYYTVTWKDGDTVLETDDVLLDPLTNWPSFDKYEGADPPSKYYQGNEQKFHGWSTDPNDTVGKDVIALPQVTKDVTYYAIFTSKETFPVVDPESEPDVIVKDGATITNPKRVNNQGLKLSKELDRDEDGNFSLTMESYSTANTTMMNVTEKVPTDFVVIVDQSGSMSTEDMSASFDPVPGSMTLEDIAAGNYYIKGDDGQYYRVYAVRDYLFRYYAPNYWYVGDLVDRFGENLGWFMGNTETETTFDNQMYFREANASGKGVYHPVTMTVQGAALTYYIRFKYTNNAGQEVLFNREEESYVGTNCPYYHNVLNGNTIGPGWGIWPVNYTNVDGIVQGLYGNDNNYTYSEIEILGAHTGMLVNYPMYDRHVGYVELRYRDVNGEEHTVSPLSGSDRAEYCNANGQAITTASGTTRMNYNKLYQPKENSKQSRLATLQYSLNQFAAAVANEKDTKSGNTEAVDNRIAIVGFSSDGYNNTELLTNDRDDFSISSGDTTGGWGNYSGSDHFSLDGKWHQGVQKGDADADYSSAGDDKSGTYYGNALVSANNENIGTVNQQVSDAISALTAHGGTQPEDGFAMAKKILDSRSEKTYKMVTGDGETVDRNTIVIFFTDGQPGNNHQANQYSEANDVVEAAKIVKDTGAQVFTIGVFGESDGNPLTYAETNLKAPYDNRSYWPYMGGWVETYQSGSNYYCLRRQWRPDNADYTPVPNDTIFDYMSVVSSNYRDATDYIAPAWLSGGFNGNYIAATEGVRGTSVDGNQFYRMASSQASLVSAFTQAVTHASTISTSSNNIVLNTTSIFKDAINIVDFNVENATYTVYKQAIHVNENSTTDTMIEPGELTEIQAARPVPADGKIEYSGFDYAGNYVAYGHPDGYKLVVKVDGLEVKTFGEEVKSNADTDTLDACGIYEYGKTTPAISIQSPKVTVLKASSTYIADFGAPLIVATEVTPDGITETNVTNGNFTRNSNGQAVYKLGNDTLNGDNEIKAAVINGAYSAVDSAKINGKHVEDGDKAKVQNRLVTVIPASSVYFSDTLDTPVTIGDGSGYNAGLANQVGTAASQSAQNTNGTFYFTFYGTGIDVYCTTHNEGGYVSATLYQGSGQSACVKDNRKGSAKTIRNYSSGDYYNTPSVSFTGLTADTYTLKIMAIESAQYKLDGVRVYNPVQAGSAAETELNKTDEANATYLNLRKVLLNDSDGKDVFTVTNSIPTGDVNPSAVSGVLFIDDVSKVVTTSNWYKDEGATEETFHDEPGQIYQSQFDVYKANGPKNEIYLNNGQAVTFQLNTAQFDENTKVYIGLSAPKTGNGDVLINGEEVDPAVTTVMDMYYPIDIDLEQAENNTFSVTIENAGSGIISVTNLKITGIADLIPATTNSNQTEVLNATRALFAPVTMKTVRMAANNGIDPDGEKVKPEEPAVTEDPEETEKPDDGSLVIDEPEETVTPTPSVTPDKPAETGNTIQKVIQSITNSISSFFKGLFRR